MNTLRVLVAASSTLTGRAHCRFIVHFSRSFATISSRVAISNHTPDGGRTITRDPQTQIDMIYIAQTSVAPRLILKEPGSSGRAASWNMSSRAYRIGRNQERMSKNFERWKALAELTSTEQDPAKLTQLATEMNRVLTQKTQYIDPALREALE